MTNLLDAPDVPIVGEGPSPDATEGASSDDTVLDSPADAAFVAFTYGVTVHELDVAPDVVVGFDITVTSPAIPAFPETGRWTEDATQLGDPVVADDGGIWAMTPDGRTVRRDPDTGEVATVQRTGTDTGWLPIGRYHDGLGSVLVVEVGLRDTTVAASSTVHMATADGALPFRPFPGTDDLPLANGERVVAAAAAGEELVVLTGDDAGTQVVLLPSGRPGTDLLDVRGLDIALTDVAIVGREAWVTGRSDAGGAVLRRIDLDTREVVVVPLPSDVRAIDRASAAPDGGAVALGVRDAAGVTSTLVVDVERSRTGAIADALTWLDTAALVDLLPFGGSAAPPAAAACAGEPVNAPPAGDVFAVWFLCWDAAGQLPAGAAHPFVAAHDRFAGADLIPDSQGMQVVLQAWAAGPTPQERAAGLSGGLDREVAEVATTVAILGTRVEIDLTSGPEIGVLGTTTARATTVQAIVGAALQFDGRGDVVIDEVVLTLDGSCADWATLAEAEGCPTYTAADAPWGQDGP